MTVGRRLTSPWISAIATAVVLGVILIGAAAVRMIGIDAGRPFAYHQDEWLIFRPAMAMVHDRDWNPHSFLYPSLLIDLQAVVTGVLRWLGGPPLETDQGWLFGTELLPVQFRYLLGGRLMVMTLGLATILVVFETGRRLRGRVAGIVAAALLAAMPLHISDSRHLTTDVPVALSCALTLLLTVKADSDRGDRWWLLAGVAAGLAMSTKWNGLLVVAVPLLAYFLPANDLRDIWVRLRSRTPYLIGAAALVALIATTPAILLDASAVVDAWRLQADVYGAPRTGVPSDSVLLNLRGLVAGLGPIAAIVAGLGVLRCLIRPRRRVELVIPAFVVAVLVITSLPARQYDRNLIPILPYLAVAAACFLADVPDFVRRTAARGRDSQATPLIYRGAMAATVVVIIACVGLGMASGAASGWRGSDLDTRTIARDWLLANVARNTVIARERETPMLMPGEFRLRPRFYLATRPLDWYRDAGTQLLVTSSFAYSRFVGNPETPGPDAWYRGLFDLHPVFRVEPGSGRPGPTITVYQLAPFEDRHGAPGG